MDEMEKVEQAQAVEAEKQPAEQEAPKETYVPRPAWQVWGARIALVIFIIFLIMYYINVARGGA